MKALLFTIVLAATAAPAMADVGVSVNLGQPGFYGQINLGDVPQPPQVIYSQPVIIQQTPDYVAEPVYLRVRPGYESNWANHCGEYNACGRQVYFVRDDWYNREYVPRYRHGGRGYDQGRGNRDNGHGRGHDRDDRHGRDHDRNDHDRNN